MPFLIKKIFLHKKLPKLSNLAFCNLTADTIKCQITKCQITKCQILYLLLNWIGYAVIYIYFSSIPIGKNLGFLINTSQVPNKVFLVPKNFCIFFLALCHFCVRFAKIIVSAVNSANRNSTLCRRHFWCRQIVSQQIATHPFFLHNITKVQY